MEDKHQLSGTKVFLSAASVSLWRECIQIILCHCIRSRCAWIKFALSHDAVRLQMTAAEFQQFLSNFSWGHHAKSMVWKQHEIVSCCHNALALTPHQQWSVVQGFMFCFALRIWFCFCSTQKRFSFGICCAKIWCITTSQFSSKRFHYDAWLTPCCAELGANGIDILTKEFADWVICLWNVWQINRSKIIALCVQHIAFFKTSCSFIVLFLPFLVPVGTSKGQRSAGHIQTTPFLFIHSCPVGAHSSRNSMQWQLKWVCLIGDDDCSQWKKKKIVIWSHMCQFTNSPI